MIALQSSKSTVSLDSQSSMTKARPIPPMPSLPPTYAATIPSATASIPLISTSSTPSNIRRRSSYSSENNAQRGSTKSLTTQRSFPHLSTKKSWRRRGSDISNKSTASSVANTYVGNTTASDSDSLLKPTALIGARKKQAGGLEPVMVSAYSGGLIRLASKKRNKDFHSIFEGISEEEKLIDDYGCALQREILAQGRLYISENHLCFYANIFGWVTNLIIDFRDVESIEKKTTAIFVPNAICITAGSTKYFFGSFISRDQAYDLLTELWKNTQMKYGTVIAQEANQCKKVDSATMLADSGLDDNSDESGYTSSSDFSDSLTYEFDDNDSLMTGNDHVKLKQIEHHPVSSFKASDNQLPLQMETSLNDAAAARRRALSETGKPRPSLKSSIRMTSEKYLPKTAYSTTNTTTSAKAASTSNISDTNANIAIAASVKASSDTALNRSNKLTQQIKSSTNCECGVKNEHYPTIVLDTKYNTSIETIYEALFASNFMNNFLNNNQKLSEVCIGEWNSGDNCIRTRQTSYIKPLTNTMGIGPKQTKCLLTEEIQYHDATDYVSQLSVCRTPDVPSGGSFSIKTRTCISWCAQGQVRVLVTVSVEFTKTCWIKTTVEKACIDGQQKFYADLDMALRDHLCNLASASHQRSGQETSTAVKSKRKGSRRRQQKRKPSDTNATSSTSSSSSPLQPSCIEHHSRTTSTVAAQPKANIISRLMLSTIHWFGDKEFTIPHQIYIIILLMLVLCQLYTGLMMASLNKQIGCRCNTVQMPSSIPPSYAQQRLFSPLFTQQLQSNDDGFQ